jgi:hypothetical protein
VASWFETREDALLATRDQIRKVLDLILRSMAKRCVSKDESIDVEIALMASLVGQNPAALKYALGLHGFMRPDTRLQIAEIGEDNPTRSRRQGTRFQRNAAATWQRPSLRRLSLRVGPIARRTQDPPADGK